VRILGVMQNPTVHVGGVNLLGAAYLLVVMLVVFLPLLLRRRGSASEDSDADSDGGGGGGGPRVPPVPPKPPGPGIPLDDARPALVRLRAPGRLADHAPAPTRRPSHPDRRRERTPSGLVQAAAAGSGRPVRKHLSER
jgi:hypothetical protein